MTCAEKYKELYPGMVDCLINGAFPPGCPHDFYIARRVKGCEKFFTCETCWNRKVPEEQNNCYMLGVELTGETMRRLGRLRYRLEKGSEDVIEAALLLYEDALNAVEKSSERRSEMYIVGHEKDEL